MLLSYCYSTTKLREDLCYKCMSFGLCHALATFHICKVNIFSDLVEKTMDIFVNDIIIYGNSFEFYWETLYQAL